MKCLSIRQEVLPANHLDLALIYNSLGSLYKSIGVYRAEEYYLNCMSIWEQVLPADHPDLATIYRKLGSLYNLKRDWTRAKEYNRKCSSIRQEVLPF
jgi:tetratricopeptide (TPR) repeat protein